MLNPASIFAEAFSNRLAVLYDRAFGRRQPHYSEIIREAASLVFERLSLSDALYHNAEHTASVTLVGQDILRGLRLKREVTPGGLAAFHAGDVVPRHRLCPGCLPRRQGGSLHHQ